MRKSILKITLPIVALSAIMAACYPGGPEYVDDYDVTYSYLVDQDYDWTDKTKKTYYMPDKVTDNTEVGGPKPVASASQILAAVAQELNDLGYIRELDSTNANNTDFVVLISRVRSDNYYYSYWYSWGYYYYYPVATVSNYQTASLAVQMIETDKIVPNPDPDKPLEFPTLWAGVYTGLFEGTTQNLTSRGQAAIHQMFKQSPYLDRN